MSRSNRRVLLVDDQPSFREGVRQLLSPYFEVTTAASGAEALTRCERGRTFAVVVSDYGMPGMTGVELLAELAQRWPDTVRIMLTGCADLLLAREALEQGAIFRFLTKPPVPEVLIEAVAAAIEHHGRREDERLFSEQIQFAREALETMNRSLEQRLEREIERLGTLERAAGELSSATSIEDLLERTTEAVRALLGAHAAEVEVRDTRDGLEIVPHTTLLPAERRSLAILAATARGVLEGARRRVRVEEAKRTTLRALQRLARHRDDETADHVLRVSAYCRLLASGLRDDGHHGEEITEEFIEHIALAAPLHDIGKVAIPDAILFKPAKLDEREWEIMRTHAEIGAEILSGVLDGSGQVDLLRMARDIAWTHHERWDGTGYPRRLAGPAIPLAGRIMSLADCYDALVSERPYKTAWPHRAALNYVEEQRGLAFDPDLVDGCLKRAQELEALANCVLPAV